MKDINAKIVAKLPSHLQSIGVLNPSFDLKCESCNYSETAAKNNESVLKNTLTCLDGLTPDSAADLGILLISEFRDVLALENFDQAKQQFCALEKCLVFAPAITSAVCSSK